MRFIIGLTAVLGLCVITPCLAADSDPAAAIQALSAGDAESRQKAADELARLDAAAEPAVPALTAALQSGDAALRWRAARALAAIGPAAAKAVPGLTKALGDSDPKVRAYSTYAFGQIGEQSKPALNSIAALLDDPDGDVRRAAIDAVLAIRPAPDTLIPILKRALESKQSDASVAVPALNALANMGDAGVTVLIEELTNDDARFWACVGLGKAGPGAAKAVPSLQLLVGHNDPEIRLQAVVALGEIGPDARAATPALIKALSDEQNSVRYGAAFALGQIGAQQAAAELSRQLESTDSFLKMISAWALAKMNPQDKTATDRAAKMLVAALKDSDPRVRAAAAQGLKDLDAPRDVVVPELLALFRDNDPVVRGNVVDALASLGESSAPRLAKALESEDTQALAVAVIRRLGDKAKDAVAALVAELSDSDPEHRREVAFALAAIGPEAKDAVPALVKALDDPEPRVRYPVCYALGKIGPPAANAVGALRNNLTSDDQFLRVASVWALMRIEPQDHKLRVLAVPMLAKALEETDSEMVKVEIASQLGEIGPPAASAIPVLKKLSAEDPSPAVRETASEAMKKIEQTK